MENNPNINSLILNQKKFSYDEIRQHTFRSQDLEEYEYQTLERCADWLNQKLFFTMHTSGSTGKPQAIQLSRRQMLQSAQTTIQALGLKAGDRALVCINTAYIGGLMMLVRGLTFNLSLYIIPPSRNPLAEIHRQSSKAIPPFDFMALIPWQFQTMLEQEKDFPQFIQNTQAIILGGAPVSYALEQSIRTFSAPIYSTYGMTETVSHIALRRLNGAEPQSCFQVLPGIQVDQDQRGCLKIKGLVTEDKWLQTNDRVEIVKQNQFIWLGRADFIINSGGIKIQGEVLERQLEEIFAKLQINPTFFISALPDEQLGQKVALIIEDQPWPETKLANLKQAMQKMMDRYKIPKNIVFFPEFIRTATEKIDRKKTISLLKKYK